MRRRQAVCGTDDISAKRANGGEAMTNQPVQTSDYASRHPIIAVLLPSLLIGHFLWNVLTPAHEFPMRSEQVMTMTLDLLMLGGLFALRLSSDGWWTGHLVYSFPPR